MPVRKRITIEDTTTKTLILKSAKKYFLKYGYQAAPLRKIVSEAGFTPGALYGYFTSKEELFYAVTDPLAKRLTDILERIRNEINTLPKKERLHGMGKVYYPHISEIVDILISDRDAVKLIVNGAKGTKYENFLNTIAEQNAKNINKAEKNSKDKTLRSIKAQTMEILMEEYITTLFRLIISDKDRKTIIRCMELIGKIYEKGIVALMQKEDENGN
jgi:transcriptional regulator, tetR family